MTYTHGHHESVLRSHRWRTVDNSAAYAAEFFVEGAHVLDVGCGPGTITLDIARRVAPGTVIGVDAATAVINEARRDAANVANVEFTAGNVNNLAYDDDSFDVVHAHQVLQHLADPVRALREMRRVCAPGGVVAVRDSDYAAFTWYPANRALDAWRDLYRTVARANEGEPDAGRYLLAWANAAGFPSVTASASTWCFATPEDRAWWGNLWADRMTDSAIAQQARDEKFATAAELKAMADAWRAWAEDPDGWIAVLHGEVLARP
jgi:ubiquinone/menaquinone biosynthesis C-methylase UbiE